MFLHFLLRLQNEAKLCVTSWIISNGHNFQHMYHSINCGCMRVTHCKTKNASLGHSNFTRTFTQLELADAREYFCECWDAILLGFRCGSSAGTLQRLSNARQQCPCQESTCSYILRVLNMDAALIRPPCRKFCTDIVCNYVYIHLFIYFFLLELQNVLTLLDKYKHLVIRTAFDEVFTVYILWVNCRRFMLIQNEINCPSALVVTVTLTINCQWIYINFYSACRTVIEMMAWRNFCVQGEWHGRPLGKFF